MRGQRKLHCMLGPPHAASALKSLTVEVSAHTGWAQQEGPSTQNDKVCVCVFLAVFFPGSRLLSMWSVFFSSSLLYVSSAALGVVWEPKPDICGNRPCLNVYLKANIKNHDDDTWVKNTILSIWLNDDLHILFDFGWRCQSVGPQLASRGRLLWLLK